MGTILTSAESLRALTAYTVVSEEPLPDIAGYGIVLQHKKSGARIAVISCEDRNKVFSIGFRTPPEDSTGVAHILEHSVLCGSKRFPVKEPFVELLKGSLNTFLNAMTYPDKTIYPIASCNDKDYANLMEVYLDAVFCPDIYRKPEIFMQEGWHYEIEDKSQPLTYNGVVYSEMKGAFSNPEDVLYSEAARTLFPDTTYGVESGGDPDVIPSLSYEQFLNFHKRYYHPVNSYIYLYGDCDMKERLEWMDREYLCNYEKITLDSSIAEQKPFSEPRKEVRFYSVNTKEEEKDAAYLSYQAALAVTNDPVKLTACEILASALVNTPGAPLKEALTKAGIGEAVYGTFDDSTMQPSFAIVAKNADEKRSGEFLQIVMDTLKKCVAEGVNKRTLLSVLNQNEFELREADPGRFPNGLRYYQMMMTTWLYNDNRVFDHVKFSAVFKKLRELIETDYFEKLITSLFFENQHAVFLKLLPKAGLLSEKEEKLAKKLSDYKEKLTEDELEAIIQKTKKFKLYQATDNTKEELDTIPRLSREDIKRSAEPLLGTQKEVFGIKTLHAELNTNRIVYSKLLFNMKKLPAELMNYVGVLLQLFTQLNTKKHSYLELNNEINIETGGISFGAYHIAKDDSLQEYNSYVAVEGKTMAEKVPEMFSFFDEILKETSFDDSGRIREVLLDQKSSLEGGYCDMAHGVASTRAMSYVTPVGVAQEKIQGIDYYDFLSELLAHFDERKEDLKEKLQKAYACVFAKENLLFYVAADETDYLETVKEFGKLVSDFPESAGDGELVLVPEKKNEGLITPGQMQYVCCTGDFRKAGLSYSGAFNVLRTAMSYDYLWQNVRVKGGAYGGGFQAMPNGRITFVSWRDPNLARTMKVYADSVEYIKNFTADEAELTKYVIGTMSGLDMPRSPRAEGERSLIAFLSGTTFDAIQKRRDEVIDVTVEDIRALAKHVEAVISQNYCCTVGSEKKIKEDAGQFLTVRDLLH